MKKLFNFISIFVLLFTFIGNAFLFQENKVNAANTQYSGIESGLEITKSGGKVTITPLGEITVSYSYGITEFMVVATSCSDPWGILKDTGEMGKLYDANGKFKSGYSWSNALSCAAFNGKVTIIHFSGRYNEKEGESQSFSLHLNDYGIRNDEIVQLQFIYDFMEKSRKETIRHEEGASYKNLGAYTPVYCELEKEYENCLGLKRIAKPDIQPDEDKWEYAVLTSTRTTLPSARVEAFAKAKNYSSYEVHVDRLGIIYAGKMEINEKPFCTKTQNNRCVGDSVKGHVASDVDREEFATTQYGEFVSVNRNGDTEVYVQAKNSGFDKSKGIVQDFVVEDIIPVLIIILGIAAALTITILGYQIVKSADEPQERREKITRLKGILVGLGIAFLLLFAAKPAIKLIERLSK